MFEGKIWSVLNLHIFSQLFSWKCLIIKVAWKSVKYFIWRILRLLRLELVSKLNCWTGFKNGVLFEIKVIKGCLLEKFSLQPQFCIEEFEIKQIKQEKAHKTKGGKETKDVKSNKKTEKVCIQGSLRCAHFLHSSPFVLCEKLC